MWLSFHCILPIDSFVVANFWCYSDLYSVLCVVQGGTSPDGLVLDTKSSLYEHSFSLRLNLNPILLSVEINEKLNQNGQLDRLVESIVLHGTKLKGQSTYFILLKLNL